ncbi:MAG TPA: hypothetical protein VKQ05_06050 [Gemmatimonadales bacterium]|nr:hypothetical protein [Gemmatimonadales bacterium]
MTATQTAGPLRSTPGKRILALLVLLTLAGRFAFALWDPRQWKAARAGR